MSTRLIRFLLIAAAVVFAVRGSRGPGQGDGDLAPACRDLKPGECNNAQTDAPKPKTPRSLESRSYYWLT